MKKVTQLVAAVIAASLFSSVPAMAQDLAKLRLAASYQTLFDQYQRQHNIAEQAQTLALIRADIQALLDAAPDLQTQEAILQAALEAAAALCVIKPSDPLLKPALSGCEGAINAVLGAASAAGLSADSIASVAAASRGVDQDLVAEQTASGGGPGVGPGAYAPGGTGFGGGSGGGGGTASGN